MKSCANCNHGKCSVFNEPCRSCEDRNKWEGVDICAGCIHEKVCMDGMANKCANRLTEKDIVNNKLEKIKAEMLGQKMFYTPDIEIIDKHIKELKGE